MLHRAHNTTVGLVSYYSASRGSGSHQLEVLQRQLKFVCAAWLDGLARTSLSDTTTYVCFSQATAAAAAAATRVVAVAATARADTVVAAATAAATVVATAAAGLAEAVMAAGHLRVPHLPQEGTVAVALAAALVAMAVVSVQHIVDQCS
eukprot:TRINITY_DN5813_c0_g1_i1.p4 TRINITY_DN5813_c0_g1~~TRINITY_DN5813_c0_g1_i1.p4  ORF type:complete len:149 (-),score=29.74 TRINITY_DN5813_c0_g1_i1:887-1333(-)